MRLRVADEQA